MFIAFKKKPKRKQNELKIKSVHVAKLDSCVVVIFNLLISMVEEWWGCCFELLVVRMVRWLLRTGDVLEFEEDDGECFNTSIIQDRLVFKRFFIYYYCSQIHNSYVYMKWWWIFAKILQGNYKQLNCWHYTCTLLFYYFMKGTHSHK